MKWAGLAMICAAVAFIIVILTPLNDHRKGVIIMTFLTVTAIIMLVVCMVLFGIMLIKEGGGLW